MTLRRFLFGGCIGLVLLPFVFVGFWTWARDDFFPRQLILSAPPQGPNRAAAVSDFDLQNDGNHILGVWAGGKWRPWTELATASEMADQKWNLIWSRDGSLVALKQSPGMLGDKSLKTALYTHAFDFARNKSHQSLDSPQESSHSPFSHRIAEMMKKGGGTVAGKETKRDVGVWRWEDEGWKRLYHAGAAQAHY